MKSLLFYILLIVSFFSYAEVKHPVVVLSIDGFAHHYLAKYRPENILALAQQGASVNGMMPAFPSKTFPNHLSLATGVYPAKHGIVHNKFYHRGLKRKYRLGAGKSNSTWLSAMPIWTRAEQQGIKTGIYFWPESEASINDILPSYYFSYDKSVTNETIMAQVVQWLILPESERPQLIMAYLSSLDSIGHHYGVNSKELVQEIDNIDTLIGQLLVDIKTHTNVTPNIVLVSDHGMINIDQGQTIPWRKLLKPFDSLNIVNGQTQLYIYEANKKRLNDVRSHLVTSRYNHLFDVYQKDQYPAHWHFNLPGQMIPDMVINAKAPATFVEKFSYSGTATHGFDAKTTDSMKAIFIANGPQIKNGLALDAIENIHVFPFIATLLNLPQANDIDGNRAVLSSIINK